MKESGQRIQNIDALRGIALSGIVIAHFAENYIAGPSPESFAKTIHVDFLDNLTDGLIFMFIRGKFFALFSFLFGLSFFLQMSRAEEKSINYSTRFLWRLVILFAIGYLHHLFYRGDILVVYALTGIFMIPFYKLPLKWIWVFCILIFAGFFRLLIFFITKGEHLFYDIEFSPNSKKVLEYYDILKEGALTDVFKINSWDGLLQKMEFQFGLFSRGYLTFGFFLLGLIAGRTKLFLNYETYLKKIKRWAVYTVILFIVFGMVTGMLMKNQQGQLDNNSLSFNLGLNFYDLMNVTMTVFFICIFIVLWRKKWGYKLMVPFADYGKMALTNYLLQTLIGTFILYGWGLGYLGEIRIIYLAAIAVLLIFVQIYASILWLKKFNYGPFEWLWRCLTYFKIFPFMKNNP